MEIEDLEWDAAYWEYMALTARRFWFSGWDYRVYLGGDEFWRRTIVIGPLCIALWRTSDNKNRVKELERRLDALDPEVEKG